MQKFKRFVMRELVIKAREDEKARLKNSMRHLIGYYTNRGIF